MDRTFPVSNVVVFKQPSLIEQTIEVRELMCGDTTDHVTDVAGGVVLRLDDKSLQQDINVF